VRIEGKKEEGRKEEWRKGKQKFLRSELMFVVFTIINESSIMDDR
jgi:hypothetical protein